MNKEVMRGQYKYTCSRKAGSLFKKQNKKRPRKSVKKRGGNNLEHTVECLVIKK